MLIAVPAETDPGKGRVAATPETAGTCGPGALHAATPRSTKTAVAQRATVGM